MVARQNQPLREAVPGALCLGSGALGASPSSAPNWASFSPCLGLSFHFQLW